MFLVRTFLLRSLLAAAAMALPTVVIADPIADFYTGKQLRIIVRAAPGGSYDTYSRLLGRYMNKYLPGNPTAVLINMPGGGGVKALGYVAKVAPKDGTFITMVTQSFPMDQALGNNKALDIDLRTLNWIGNMSEENQILYTSPASQTHTLEEAKKRETMIGATGIGATTTQLVALYNNAIGTKFKIIYGYPGGAEIGLAIERGELEGRNTSNPQQVFMGSGKQASDYHFLIQTGLKKFPDYPNVPLLLDLAKDADQRTAFDLISKAAVVSRPFAAAGGIPQERVAALRKAFEDTFGDPDFLAEAKKQDLEIALTKGGDLQRIVGDIIAASPATIERMRALMVVRSAEAVKGMKASEGSE